MGNQASRFRVALMGGGALTLALAAQPAVAADAAAKGSAESATTIESVVVTARRSSEKLQEVPIAVTAVTAKQLETLKPRTLEDLNGIAPNVEIGRVGAGAGSSAIYIRGLGYSDIEKGQNPAVGLLIDDVVIGTNTAQLIDSFDIAQVEISRGPQGIFFGKNTTAGAISIHRTRPTHAWGANVSVGYGDYRQNAEKITLNAPLGETAGLKVGYSFRSRHGFLDNLYTQKSYGRDALSTGTVALDWNLTPDLHLLATADFTHQYGEGTPVALGNPLAAQVYSFLPAVIPGLAYNKYGSPFIPGVTIPLGPLQVANDFPDRNLLTQQRYALNVDYNTPIGQLVSVTAFIHQHDDAEQDFDGSCGASVLGGGVCRVLPNPILGFLHTSRPQKYDQFTEEVRLSHDFGSRAKATVGAYYFHHTIEALQLTRTKVPGVPPTSPITNQISGERNHSISVFGNLDVNVTSQLKISGGLRYIDESTSFHNAFNIIFPPGTSTPQGPPFRGSESWSKVITRFSADYRLSDTSLLYISRSQGFRSGGFSPRGTLSESRVGSTNFSPGANYATFNPETDVSYELGAKNTFLNGQVVLNVAGFWNIDKDHQAGQVVTTPGDGPGTNTYIVNIPRVRIRGAEFEFAYRPEQAPGLTLTASGGMQNAKITNGKLPGVVSPIGPGGQAGAPGTVSDITGKPLERVGKYNYRVGIDYVFDVGPGAVDVTAAYNWTDKYLFTTLAGLGDYQPSFGLLNASASYSWKQYKLTVAGKNLTDKVYRSNSLPVVFFQGWGDPRTVFVELQAKF
ncbi:TonB-dependent receptor [Phenylobacterium sp.]|uniref:TonB-dependent receptor n=1 Tax=Phenylobacterium sp. TaxID=1871053 RepID=UPI0025E88BE0|nr:TonB-dependent receptor [Phenylobacterium sp.]